MCRCWECAWACRHWRWRMVQLCSTLHIQCTATCPASPTAGTHCLRAFHQVSGTHHGRSVRRYLLRGCSMLRTGGCFLYLGLYNGPLHSYRSGFRSGALSLTSSAHKRPASMPRTDSMGARRATCGGAAHRERGCCRFRGAPHGMQRRQLWQPRTAQPQWDRHCCRGRAAGAHGPCTQGSSPSRGKCFPRNLSAHCKRIDSLTS